MRGSGHERSRVGDASEEVRGNPSGPTLRGECDKLGDERQTLVHSGRTIRGVRCICPGCPPACLSPRVFPRRTQRALPPAPCSHTSTTLESCISMLHLRGDILCASQQSLIICLGGTWRKGVRVFPGNYLDDMPQKGDFSPYMANPGRYWRTRVLAWA